VSQFEAERDALMRDLAESRAGLTAVVERLSSTDFSQARRGSWSVARILAHVLHSERLYTQLLSVFSGKGTGVHDPGDLTSAAEAIAALGSSRLAFLGAVEGVGEDDFYRLQAIGHEEYSVLSILENNAAHDREHAEQIRKTIEQ
jgi:hypothetical protein